MGEKSRMDDEYGTGTVSEGNSFVVKSNDRIAFIGKTGSGKSYLAKTLMKPLNRVIFIDPKCEHKTSELRSSAVLFTSWVKAKKKLKSIFKDPKFFIHIKPMDVKQENLDLFLNEVFRLGNVTVIFDETGRFCYPQLCIEHDRIMRQGRARGIGAWHLVQRPAYVDNYVFSESEHSFVFQLKTENDRKKISGMITETSKEVLETDLRALYHFYYDNVNEGCRFCKPI